MNPIDYLKNLPLNPDQYVVVGSALLSVKGIKPLNDIDLLVHPKLFRELENQGWKSETVVQEGKSKTRLSHGICEAFLEFRGKSFNEWTHNQSILEVLEGISFLNFETILQVKEQWNRKKDGSDIHLIKDYLSKKSS